LSVYLLGGLDATVKITTVHSSGLQKVVHMHASTRVVKLYMNQLESELTMTIASGKSGSVHP
jgi:hypothetical protein